MTEMQLNNAALAGLDPARVGLPAYDRKAVSLGVIHLGPGAFHRAHQAAYFDKLLAHDPGFGVLGVSMRSRGVADALAPQDGLYTLAVLDDEISYKIIGSVLDVITADDPALEAAFITPDLKIISLTITEKGYCLAGDGTLELSHPDIAADLKGQGRPRSAIGMIAVGLKARMDKGLSAPDVISCDNLPGNGAKLRAAVIAFAGKLSSELSDWIEREVRFPNTMVDSITPATDDALRSRVAEEAGVVDNMPVQREAFADWVVEDIARCADALRTAGAIITPDVEGFEAAKLRMLNGPHSTLAYRGLALGYATVAEAMTDATLSGFIDALMRDEIAPSIAAPAGLDLDQYRADLIKRFQNPAIAHKLSQIAWDGSQKLPIRLLATIEDNLRDGRPIEKLSIGVAAWMRFIRRAALANADIVDPMDDALKRIGAKCADDPSRDVDLFVNELPVVPDRLASNAAFQSALVAAYDVVMDDEKSGKLGA